MTDWDKELQRLSTVLDPPVDQAVAHLLRNDPDYADPRALFAAVSRDLRIAKERREPYAGVLKDAVQDASSLPPWAGDTDRIRRGQRVFNDHGAEMGAALVFAALPVAYASVQGADALGRTSELAGTHPLRRVGETGQMIVDVMGMRDPSALEPGGLGFTTAVGVRLLHGCVRGLLCVRDAAERWPAGHAPPLNQAIMAATLLDFTVVTWTALEKMGVKLTEEEKDAHLYAWSIVGHVMGLEVCRDRALTLQDIPALDAAMSRQLGRTQSGPHLMGVLLHSMEGMMPLGWRKVPRSMVWWLFENEPFGTDQVPHLLDVPPPAWWSKLVFSEMRELQRLGRLPIVKQVGRLVERRVGRLVILGFVDGLAPGAPMFCLPPPLARSWGLRTGGPTRHVRALRRRARARVRAVTPIGGPVKRRTQ